MTRTVYNLEQFAVVINSGRRTTRNRKFYLWQKRQYYLRLKAELMERVKVTFD